MLTRKRTLALADYDAAKEELHGFLAFITAQALRLTPHQNQRLLALFHAHPKLATDPINRFEDLPIHLLCYARGVDPALIKVVGELHPRALSWRCSQGFTPLHSALLQDDVQFDTIAELLRLCPEALQLKTGHVGLRSFFPLHLLVHHDFDNPRLARLLAEPFPAAINAIDGGANGDIRSAFMSAIDCRIGMTAANRAQALARNEETIRVFLELCPDACHLVDSENLPILYHALRGPHTCDFLDLIISSWPGALANAGEVFVFIFGRTDVPMESKELLIRRFQGHHLFARSTISSFSPELLSMVVTASDVNPHITQLSLGVKSLADEPTDVDLTGIIDDIRRSKHLRAVTLLMPQTAMDDRHKTHLVDLIRKNSSIECLIFEGGVDSSICSGLSENSTLYSLSIEPSDRQITDPSHASLVQVLRSNTNRNLRRVILKNHATSYHGSVALAQALGANTSVQYFVLERSQMSTDQRNAFIDHVEAHNTTLRVCEIDGDTRPKQLCALNRAGRSVLRTTSTTKRLVVDKCLEHINNGSILFGLLREVPHVWSLL
jgi:hypothetical protein